MIFFYVILSKVQPTWFNINHTLPCCRGALQSGSETVDSCEHPAGYEYTLSWARADDMMRPHSGSAAYYISDISVICTSPTKSEGCDIVTKVTPNKKVT